MRDPELRSKKYEAKISGDVAKARIDAQEAEGEKDINK
jgi:hypothetical protein